jgi:hypothetical protein
VKTSIADDGASRDRATQQESNQPPLDDAIRSEHAENATL